MLINFRYLWKSDWVSQRCSSAPAKAPLRVLITSIASRGEFEMRTVTKSPAGVSSISSAAEKKSSSTSRRSRPRSSQYFTILGSIGVVIPVLNSFECRCVTSKLGLN